MNYNMKNRTNKKSINLCNRLFISWLFSLQQRSLELIFYASLQFLHFFPVVFSEQLCFVAVLQLVRSACGLLEWQSSPHFLAHCPFVFCIVQQIFCDLNFPFYFRFFFLWLLCFFSLAVLLIGLPPGVVLRFVSFPLLQFFAILDPFLFLFFIHSYLMIGVDTVHHID